MAQIPSDDPKVPPTLLRISTLGPFTIEYRDPHTATFVPLPKEKWHGKGAMPAFSLLELFISQPHRYAPQDWILEQFWPDMETSKAEDRLHDASYFLRRLLSPFTSEENPFFWYVRHTKTGGGGYRLAEYPLIWIDADAFAWYMQHAALYERMGDDPFPFLEKAYQLGARGTFLVEEVYSEWAEARRKELDGALRLCVHQLGRHCLEKRDFIQAEYFVRSYWVNHMTDEDALRLLIDILGEQGRYQEAYDCYRQTKSIREQEREAIDPRTHDLAEYWRTKPISRPAKSDPQPARVPSSVFPSWTVLEHLLKPRHSENETLWQLGTSLVQSLPVTYNKGDQLLMLPPLEMLEMLMLSRRQALSDAIKLAGSSLVLSPYASLPRGNREHIELAVAHSSYVNDDVLDDLAVITQKYWKLREKSAGIDLLGAITEHLTTITQLLKESRPTGIYKGLCALASETARLLGQIFHEIREWNLAWNHYAFALNMAQEINDANLWGSVVARLAELLIYWGEPQEALSFLEEAQKRGIDDQRLRVQLASIEAEVYARAKDMDACLRALAESEKIPLTVSLADDRYRTGFNPSVAKGWEGACWIWMGKPELALPALDEALATYEPANVLRRSYLLANRGRVYGQLGDLKTSCKLLLESLNITAQTKSLIALQRVYQGRSELDPWKESGDVKELDERIVEVYRSLAGVRERV
jgi:DNA-binding SARP family transcriptional activator